MPIAPKKQWSVEELRATFRYEENTGHLYWMVSPKQSRVQIGEVAGCVKANGYVRIQFRSTLLQAHRVAWAIHYGVWPDLFIDHVNRDRSDNRIENLRLCSHAENMANRGKSKSNKTGFKGVSMWGKRYRASIGVNGKNVKLGVFSTPEEAFFVYEQAAKHFHGEFASI